jgi:hypothetical protein
MILLFPAIALR